MSIRTFWVILIKILGLFLISQALTIIPEWISSIYFIYENGDNKNLIILIVSILFVLFLFYLISRFFLFKANWIIDKLKLDKGFENDNIVLNSNGNKIISIAIIVIGGYMLLQNIPDLFRQFFVFFQDKNLFRDYPKSGWIIYYFCKAIIGYLLMTNSFRIAKFIEKQK
ncbi:hypothetical protein BC749_10768 [Flavobacterium araucananum]|uniref:Uncharacterized protein n=1 Tax=Flavobacterium araucananum TaxID=946678 RepID=A0A227ND66_9FLAO|nr:hypothetical protein [Flavobacterium araucananum]OXE95614.1 hypothetical protein B0A64_24335 [Flavobacterium araucananum]PWJ97272.1 hypothetical protein BC749_10768 [Flavobacterium araucananum]